MEKMNRIVNAQLFKEKHVPIANSECTNCHLFGEMCAGIIFEGTCQTKSFKKDEIESIKKARALFTRYGKYAVLKYFGHNLDEFLNEKLARHVSLEIDSIKELSIEEMEEFLSNYDFDDDEKSRIFFASIDVQEKAEIEMSDEEWMNEFSLVSRSSEKNSHEYSVAYSFSLEDEKEFMEQFESHLTKVTLETVS